MDFKQLEAYVKTVELSSFSKAAEDLFVSQPSISNYIGNLEKEFGTKLLIRTTGGTRPTKNGKIFYSYAKNILSLKEKAFFTITSRSGAAEGKIEIHASSVPAQYIVPDIMTAFNKAHPKISFDIVRSDTEDVIENIVAQNCELGIVGGKPGGNKCNYKFLLSEELILIAPPDRCGPIGKPAEFIYGENFITREEGSATREHAEAFLASLGVRPEKLKVVAQLSDSQSIIHAVSKGLGVSMVSEIAARAYIKNNLVSVVPLEQEMPKRAFYIVTKSNAILSPQAELFVKFVRDYFRSPNS